MNRIVLPAKRTVDTVILPVGGLDMSSQLQAGETISSVQVSVSVYSGTDPNPAAILSGAASVAGNIITQLFTGGVLGVIYEVLFEVFTSLGQTIGVPGYLAIIADLP
jgi:hypothetical protein